MLLWSGPSQPWECSVVMEWSQLVLRHDNAEVVSLHFHEMLIQLLLVLWTDLTHLMPAHTHTCTHM